MHRIWIAQEQSSAKQNALIGLTVEYALSEYVLQKPLKFTLTKDLLNESFVRIFIVTADKRSLIQELRYGDKEPISFSLDVTALRNSQPLRKLMQIANPQKFLWAFYYAWYKSLDVWENPKMLDRPLLPYISSDQYVVAHQIEQAKNAGINGFIVSWDGPHSRSNLRLQMILNIARYENFRVAMYVEIMRPNKHHTYEVHDPEKIYEWLKYAISTYKHYPAFMKINGKPLIVIYVSDLIPAETWKNMFDRLHQSNLDAIFIADFHGSDPALDSLNAFDGLHTYNILSIISDDQSIPFLANSYETIGRAVRYYFLLDDLSSPKIWMATVEPGYDDHLIPGRPGKILPREDGALYRGAFSAAIESNPDWIAITSWNEWLENTQIEPGELYGTQFLKLTKEFSLAWHSR